MGALSPKAAEHEHQEYSESTPLLEDSRRCSCVDEERPTQRSINRWLALHVRQLLWFMLVLSTLAAIVGLLFGMCAVLALRRALLVLQLSCKVLVLSGQVVSWKLVDTLSNLTTSHENEKCPVGYS